MRSFINWGILQRIENSPKDFIVQRKVSLLSAFLFGYEDCYLQLENEKQLELEYEGMLSLEEYAREKYHAGNIGTRNFESIISFTCEDERDFFYKYLDFLKEYEQKHPVKDVISFSLKETPLFELKEMLGGMRKRYPMYFGNYDISGLRAFFDGYFLCKKEYNIPLTAFEIKVREFTDRIICETLNISGEFVTWDRLYRFDRDWQAWGEIEERTAKGILENFWVDLEEFIGEKIE